MNGYTIDVGFKHGRCGNFGGFGIDHFTTHLMTGDAVPGSPWTNHSTHLYLIPKLRMPGALPTISYLPAVMTSSQRKNVTYYTYLAFSDLITEILYGVDKCTNGVII